MGESQRDKIAADGKSRLLSEMESRVVGAKTSRIVREKHTTRPLFPFFSFSCTLPNKIPQEHRERQMKGSERSASSEEIEKTKIRRIRIWKKK
jgi:hypothetical protein